MKQIKPFCFISGLIILFLAGCCSVRDHEKEELVISGSHIIYFGNFTEIIVVPGQEKCRIVQCPIPPGVILWQLSERAAERSKVIIRQS